MIFDPHLSTPHERAIGLLRQQGFVQEGHLDRARVQSQTQGEGRGLAFYLVDLEIVSAEQLRSALQEVTGDSVLDLDSFPTTPDVSDLLPIEELKALRAVPVALLGRTLHVAVDDPLNLDAVQRIQEVTRLDAIAKLTDEHSLWRRIRALEAASSAAEDIVEGDFDVLADEAVTSIQRELQGQEQAGQIERHVEQSHVDQILRMILKEGVTLGASDIHVEFFRSQDHGYIRFRVDGELVRYDRRVPSALSTHLIGRIKVLADGIDSVDKRRPQDGRIRRKIQGRDIEFRVSTLPTQTSEKVVLRILDHSAQALDFEKLGIEGKHKQTLLRALSRDDGLILLTGPTGSGKSTTLYSMLNHLRDDSVNIITVEDPIEREMIGITQVPASSTDDGLLSFASVLRSMLRQDPDILMVGEIRDRETGEIAVKASMTGHLVLSTVHTNDAPSTVTRMLDMGLQPYQVAAALRLVIAQRLIRRICTHCKDDDPTATPQRIAALGPYASRLTGMTPQKGRGCGYCRGTGYRGRVGIYEMLEVTDRMHPLILEQKSTQEIQAMALKNDMWTLRRAGIERVREGVTTLDEILREV